MRGHGGRGPASAIAQGDRDGGPAQGPLRSRGESDLLKCALPKCSNKKLAAALADLQGRALIVFRKFARAYAIFEGSDFDIDHAVGQASAGMDEIDLASVGALAGLQPIVAKRHYHETGALRWFDLGIVPLVEVEKGRRWLYAAPWRYWRLLSRDPQHKARRKMRRRRFAESALMSREWDTVMGLSQSAWSIPALAAGVVGIGACAR